jgi:RNA methyltransferase, TrmH family
MENLNLKHLLQFTRQNPMISKNKIKLIRSLAYKKYRQRYGLFLVEGDKSVLEVLNSNYHINELYASENFLSSHENIIHRVEKIFKARVEEIQKASLLTNPQNTLAVCYMPSTENYITELTGLSVFLDGIQDPGNLGTIIRACDWFGIEQLICSPDTVDVYNPKVIQASMGSFCRVKIIYVPFNDIAGLAGDSQIPIYGTFTKGHNIYKEILPHKAIVVFGNEGRGISKEVSQRIEHKISIPSFDNKAEKADSLNVAITAAIVCSEFRRKTK